MNKQLSIDEILDYIENYAVTSAVNGHVKGQYTKSRKTARQALFEHMESKAPRVTPSQLDRYQRTFLTAEYKNGFNEAIKQYKSNLRGEAQRSKLNGGKDETR